MAYDEELLQLVGARVREVRTRRKLSQQQVADRIGMTRSAIANLEAGRQDMNITRVTGLAAALGVDVATLIRPGDLPELPAPPPEAHEVVIRPVLEVSCVTCGSTVLDVTGSRDAARQTRATHIAEMLEKEAVGRG